MLGISRGRVTSQITKRRAVLATVAALFFAGSFLLGGFPGHQGQAGPLPGFVAQDASASASGLTIALQGAVFSGTGVDVDLLVSSADSRMSGLAVAPAGAQLGNEVVLSAHTFRDGRTVLTFPPAAWKEGAATAALSIRQVKARDAGENPVEIDGDWELTLQLPQGEDASAARYLESLPPATADIAGQQVVFETLRSKSATIVHYALPRSVVTFSPPLLKVGDELVRPDEARSNGGQSSVQYGSTPDVGPISLVFEGLWATDSTHSWTLELSLGAFTKPPASEGVATHGLSWQLVAGAGGPEVKSVEWDHRLYDVQLVVTVGGLWDPGPGGPPPAAMGRSSGWRALASSPQPRPGALKPSSP